VFCLALMPKWFSAKELKRQYLFNRAKPAPVSLRSHWPI
jgi:hypothetical protein